MDDETKQQALHHAAQAKLHIQLIEDNLERDDLITREKARQARTRAEDLIVQLEAKLPAPEKSIHREA
jgi:hypothetical protein